MINYLVFVSFIKYYAEISQVFKHLVPLLCHKLLSKLEKLLFKKKVSHKQI